MKCEDKLGERSIVGLVEYVMLKGKDGQKKILARIDTGAVNSAIDARLVAELTLGPIVKTKSIKSTHGNSLRPVIMVDLELKKINLHEEFTVADRGHMKYPALIGQNILKKYKFLVDPCLNATK
jgi:hypothetical protein